MNNPDHISESLETFFWVKYFNSLMRVRDPGWKKFGFGTNIPDLQHWLPVPVGSSASCAAWLSHHFPAAGHLYSAVIQMRLAVKQLGLAVKPLGLAVKQLGLAVKQLGLAALHPSSRNLDALTAGSRELLTLFISGKQMAIRTQIFLAEKVKNGKETV